MVYYFIVIILLLTNSIIFPLFFIGSCCQREEEDGRHELKSVRDEKPEKQAGHCTNLVEIKQELIKDRELQIKEELKSVRAEKPKNRQDTLQFYFKPSKN